MGKMMMAAATVAALLTAPVAAATFTVSPGAEFAVPGNNNFAGDLAALGLFSYRTTGATITLSANSRLRFDFMASESGQTNTFVAGGLPAFAEFDKGWAPILIGFEDFLAGTLTGISFNGGTVNIGDAGFGIFTPGNVREYTSNVLYFGLDDFVTNADDNHDDFIVRVTAVPEPQSWAMLIVGFGMIGFAARRRRMVSVTA